MPFQASKTLKNKKPQTILLKERRKIRSILEGILPSHHMYSIHPERASAFISLDRKRKKASSRYMNGSITVEASAVVPLFFFAMVCLFYLMEIMAVQTSVRAGLQYAGKEVAKEGYQAVMTFAPQLEAKVIKAIGTERLSRSIVDGKAGGIDCSESVISPITGVGKLSVKYKIRIPIPVFHIGLIPYEETMRIKVWNGYKKTAFGNDSGKIVYLTENGIVYHTDYHCTYLEPSIRLVSAEDVQSLRNHNGGKYHACERCGGGNGLGVYITDNGDRYHSSVGCSGLKRTVYAVDISETAGKSLCSKCGK